MDTPFTTTGEYRRVCSRSFHTHCVDCEHVQNLHCIESSHCFESNLCFSAHHRNSHPFLFGYQVCSLNILQAAHLVSAVSRINSAVCKQIQAAHLASAVFQIKSAFWKHIQAAHLVSEVKEPQCCLEAYSGCTTCV